MFKKLALFNLVFLLFLAFACSPKPAPLTPETKKAPEAATVPATAGGWADEWERVKKEARKEGKLVLFTTAGTELRQAWYKALKEYGIELESFSGRGIELSERLIRERRAGIYNVDLYMSGLDTFVNTLKPEGVLAPIEPLLILPEVKDAKYWYKGRLNFADKQKTILAFVAYVDPGIHINTDMVGPGEIKSMQDLLSPKWTGKMIMDDPTVPGRGGNWMAVVMVKLGDDYARQLAKQKPLLTRDRRLLVDWLAKSRYSIGLGVYPDQYMEFKRAGAPLDNLPLKEVAYLLAGIGFVSHIEKSPHPNATKVFLNLLLSKEGQTAWQQIRNDQSARVDTPTEHLVKSGQPLRLLDVDYYDARNEVWELEISKKGKASLVEIFTPLLR